MFFFCFRTCNKKGVITQFKRILSLASRLTGNYRKGTPTLGLAAALGYLPIQYQVQITAISAYKRLKVNDTIARRTMIVENYISDVNQLFS